MKPRNDKRQRAASMAALNLGRILRFCVPVALTLFGSVQGCYEAPELNLSERCHPEDPACALEDEDGDGVLNGADDYPLDPRCSVESIVHCGGCDRPCPAQAACIEGQCVPGEAERCDGLDNDRDGVVDESLDAPPPNSQRGICAGLVRSCLGAAGWGDAPYMLLPNYESDERSCDGLDNDCDGSVDEALVAPPANEQRGVCAGRLLSCAGTQGWQRPDRSERRDYERDEGRCDGLDNDCDGAVDEGLSGHPCQLEALGRCAIGRQRCVGGTLRCEPSYSPAQERCNGDDDDCDGLIDEALTPPLFPLGVCARRPPLCRGAEGWKPDLTPLPAYEENEASCDGLDNDCDGFIDEQLSGDPCETGLLDRCAEGRFSCEAGRLLCRPSAALQHERCDGVDEDCDGAVDELLDPPLSAQQNGVCAGLVQRCGGIAGWVDFGPASAPTGETDESRCDGLDNDCDGLVDESLGGDACESEGLGLCALGQRLCQAGRQRCVPTYLPTTERCDGLDNDCDGHVDETLTIPSAQLSEGICAGALKRCGGAEGWIEPPPPVAFRYEETLCDGLDEDCDGRLDEALEAPLIANQLGICAGATMRCAGAEGWRDLGPPSVPGYGEGDLRCDGLDNDCDGRVDEGVVEGSCETALPGRCHLGVLRCDSATGAPRCLPMLPPVPERCDGVDEDCDGLIDEGTGGAPCLVGEGVCRRPGALRCAGTSGDFICVGEPGQGQDELCNGADDDCDGRIDEESLGDGLRCLVGVGACAREGEQRCEDAVLSCDQRAASPEPERCDGLDNDCDGLIDETYLQLGLPCVVGSSRCQQDGVWRCDAEGEVRCDAIPLPSEPERCDGLDNDCDGWSDEHRGAERCDGVDNDCDNLVDENSEDERCDDVDNDCDGAVDESPCAPCLDSAGGCPTFQWTEVNGGVMLFGGEGGDREPARWVTVGSFELSQEVKSGAYSACVETGACAPPVTGGQCTGELLSLRNHPINCISWSEARRFARWVGADLPSEIQWEFAARGAGEGPPYPWGFEAPSCLRAQMNDPAAGGAGCGGAAVAPTCQLPLGNSPQGLCDLAGNLREWTLDQYQPHLEGLSSTGAPRCLPGCAGEAELRVWRGGAWSDNSDRLDARYRGAADPGLRSPAIGFRLFRRGAGAL